LFRYSSSIAHTLSIMAFFEFLSAITSVVAFTILVLWPAVANMVKAYGAYVIAGLLTAFGLVATIGIPAIVVPAANDSELISVGLGTYW
jgi:hypothetical protein